MAAKITFSDGIFADGLDGTQDPSAIIQSDSTTQGVLIPRHTTTTRDEISSVPLSLRIFNTTTNQFEFHNGSAWVAVGASATVSAENVTIATGVGSPTIDQVQAYLDNTGSSGFFAGGAVTDGGSGTIDIAAGSGFIRASASSTAPLLSFKWSAQAGVAVTNDTTQYIFVDNTGVITLNSDQFLEVEDNIIIGVATDEGGVIVSVYNFGVRLDDSLGAAGRFLRRVHGVTRDNARGGLIVTETGTRNLVLSTGHLLFGRTDENIPALNTSISDTFTTYSVAGQEASAATQWDNLQYDNAGTLTTLTNNRWANHYFYLELNGNLTMIYGRAQYTTQALAEDESPPTSSLPNKLTAGGLLIMRLTFLKSAATATISSAFDTIFSGSGSSATVFSDDVFEVRDNSDNTKIVKFEASGVPTSTTATINVTTSVTLLKDNLAGTVPPTTTDDSASGYSVGSHWVDVVANLGYICVDATTSAAVWVEVTAGASGGEANTASNIGVGGVGFFDAKVGVDLQFRNAIAGSTKLTVVDVPANNEVAFDVVEAQLTLDNLGGTLGVAKGGTGSTTAIGARTNLGLAINTDVQAWDAQLDDIAALVHTDGNFIVGNGANWVAEAGATARASLGIVSATDSAEGLSELATTAETSTGTDTTRTIPVSALPLQIQDSKYTYVLTTGSANAYVASFTPTPSTYVNGQVFYIKASFANTGAATLAINGQAAKAIVTRFNVALVANDIVSGMILAVAYDVTGDNLQMLSPVANAAGGGGASIVSDEYTPNEGSDYTTTSTSFVDVDATNLALTITTTGGDVEVHFDGNAYNASLTEQIFFDVDVDGTREGLDDGFIYIITNSGKQPSFTRLITGLSAASHTFKLQWKTTASTATIPAGAGSAGSDVHPQFWVREIS